MMQPTAFEKLKKPEMAARMNDLSLPSHGRRVDLAGRYEAWYMAQTQQASPATPSTSAQGVASNPPTEGTTAESFAKLTLVGDQPSTPSASATGRVSPAWSMGGKSSAESGVSEIMSVSSTVGPNIISRVMFKTPTLVSGTTMECLDLLRYHKRGQFVTRTTLDQSDRLSGVKLFVEQWVESMKAVTADGLDWNPAVNIGKMRVEMDTRLSVLTSSVPCVPAFFEKWGIKTVRGRSNTPASPGSEDERRLQVGIHKSIMHERTTQRSKDIGEGPSGDQGGSAPDNTVTDFEPLQVDLDVVDLALRYRRARWMAKFPPTPQDEGAVWEDDGHDVDD